MVAGPSQVYPLSECREESAHSVWINRKPIFQRVYRIGAAKRTCEGKLCAVLKMM